jgi:tRNA1(Val) A37 N6-methylase TrmN6
LDVTDDAVLGGRLKLKQPARGHRVGHDAILLAAAISAAAGDLAVDLGSGVGSAGLALAARVAGVRIALVERDGDLSALAEENIGRNGFADRAHAFALDVTAPQQTFAAAGLHQGCADHVLMNPPFNDPARHNRSPDAGRRAAHMSPPLALESWTETASRLLRPGGVLTVIWRAEGLVQVLAALEARFGGLAVLPVHSVAAKPAIRVLVRAIKGSAAPLRLQPSLLLQQADGKPTSAAEAILRNGEALALAE